MDILNEMKRLREEEGRLKWEGTFREYLELIQEKKEIAQTSHSRVYNMIKNAGFT